jgi:hypothetical protein
MQGQVMIDPQPETARISPDGQEFITLDGFSA